MKPTHLLLAATALCSAAILGGCSDSDTAVAPDPFKRVDPLAAQTATLSIADPAGTPVVTITQAADIELAAEVTSPGVGGAGTIDITVTATNNSTRAITNFKAITVSADSTLGTATIASTGTVAGSGALAGEDYMYFGKKLTTPAGKSATGIDDFKVTLGATPANPLVIALELPTQDVGLITANDYGGWGTTEILSFDTGVGGNRIVGSTLGYVWDDANSWSSQAAPATEGFLSPDGRYAYLGHKTRPMVMILDTVNNTVDAVELLPPPDEPYPSQGQVARIASVDSVAMSPDGQYLYANVLDGTHPYDSTGCAYGDADGVLIKNYIIKVKISSLEVVGELDVTPPGSALCDDHGTLKRLSMDSAGKIGAAAVYNRGRVVIVDLNSMTLIKSMSVDTDGNRNEPHYTAVTADGKQVYVAYNHNGDDSLDIIDTSDFSISELTPKTTASNRARDLRFGPDGRLYYARDGSQYITIFDVSASPVTETEIPNADVGTGGYSRIAFDPHGDYWYFVNWSSQLAKFHMADDATATPPIVRDTLSDDGLMATGNSSYHGTLPTKY